MTLVLFLTSYQRHHISTCCYSIPEESSAAVSTQTDCCLNAWVWSCTSSSLLVRVMKLEEVQWEGMLTSPSLLHPLVYTRPSSASVMAGASASWHLPNSRSMSLCLWQQLPDLCGARSWAELRAHLSGLSDKRTLTSSRPIEEETVEHMSQGKLVYFYFIFTSLPRQWTAVWIDG